jgi:hypothetical protein
VGGTIVDLSISDDNQTIYYVLALSEVTNTHGGGTPDAITFGDIYWGGKKCIMSPDSPNVTALLDQSTGLTDNSIGGKLAIYLYTNGSLLPANSTETAITVMSASDCAYKWDSSKKMSNCAFAIIKLQYSQTANIRGIEQTKFQVINSRSAPGDVMFDYLLSNRYGAALLDDQVDVATLEALNAYSNEEFTYTTYEGVTTTQTRFRFDGTVDTNRSIMQNLQDMASCCDCIIKYNEIVGTWGVIVQKPTFEIADHLDDSNIVSALQITPIDIANSFNVAEVKFPDNQYQDAFNSSTYDLASVAPDLLYPNEPVNKQSISLPFVNDDVRAQYLANRFLKSAREDLQVSCSVNFGGIQFEAGDVITLTNSNYGWTDKLFRLNKVSETFNDDGAVIVSLLMMEFNPSVYDDVPITQFTPAPNTGIGDPLFFGTIPAPIIGNQYPTNTNPTFLVNVTTASSGITQYAEVWYSAYASPTSDQMIFAGTTEIQASGNPYTINFAMPPVALSTIPAGNWYFFSRMVNSLGKSPYSPASAIFRWRPSTFQFTEKYVAVAYADDNTGGGFSLDPRNKSYYGLVNQSSSTAPTTADPYTWYLAEPTFGTLVYLCYSNRTGRKFSFDSSTATINGSFVPSGVGFDISLWSSLEDGNNIIDLDIRTGQLLEFGGTTVSQQDGLLNVTNNSEGKVTVALNPFLESQFGPGVYSKTSSVALLTVDKYGRVIGFEEPVAFYYTITVSTAT